MSCVCFSPKNCLISSSVLFHSSLRSHQLLLELALLVKCHVVFQQAARVRNLPLFVHVAVQDFIAHAPLIRLNHLANGAQVELVQVVSHGTVRDCQRFAGG